MEVYFATLAERLFFEKFEYDTTRDPVGRAFGRIQISQKKVAHLRSQNRPPFCHHKMEVYFFDLQSALLVAQRALFE